MADAALTILEKLAPSIEAAVQSGQITPAQQQGIYDRANALRPGGTAFSGTEWQPSTPPTPAA